MTGPCPRLFLLLCAISCAGIGFAQGTSSSRGPCIPPTAVYSTSAPNPVQLCQGEVIELNAEASVAAEGQSIEQWIWNHGANGVDTNSTPLAVLEFTTAGVHELTLEVIDDFGCSSGPTQPMVVLVSHSPDFSGTIAPLSGCEGEVFELLGVAEQPAMIAAPEACTAENNGMPLLDTPTPSISILEVAGQPNSTLTDIAQLGDICMDIEHSYLGDLVLTVSCPNGQSVVLHQQGGGGTFLGDANDADGSAIVPGTCFQYCFGLNPEFGTLLQASVGGTSPNTIPVSQGTAVAPGRYTSIQPLTQLLGCPLNGTWTFASADLFGADNGYLCGWCISFGEQPDSSYIDLGPVLGSSADSSFWSGAGVLNTPGSPGQASFSPAPGNQAITYTVVDSYGCQHEVDFDVTIGETPEVTIVNDPDLGLLCAQVVGGPVSYQWSYGGQVVVGAAGACYTPPGPGIVSVFVENAQGCSGSVDYLGTGVLNRNGESPGFSLFPNPTTGEFSLRMNGPLGPSAEMRITDPSGRIAFRRALGKDRTDAVFTLSMELAAGIYLVEILDGPGRSVQRLAVQ